MLITYEQQRRLDDLTSPNGPRNSLNISWIAVIPMPTLSGSVILQISVEIAAREASSSKNLSTGYYKCKRRPIYQYSSRSVLIVSGEVVNPRSITVANLYKKYATGRYNLVVARRTTTASVV